MDIVYPPVPSAPTFSGAITTTGGIVGPATAPAAGRGIVVQLGKLAGLNLNSVANTTIFTTPASGFTRCVVTEIILDNFSAAAATTVVSFGASATPTDYLGAQTLTNSAIGKQLSYYPAAGAAAATYGTAIAFVAAETVALGSAATCDVVVMGYYE